MDSESDQDLDEHGDGWLAARMRKFTIGLRATPTERLMWLEEMIELAYASGALPRRRDEAPGVQTAGGAEPGGDDGRWRIECAAENALHSTSNPGISTMGGRPPTRPMKKVRP